MKQFQTCTWLPGEEPSSHQPRPTEQDDSLKHRSPVSGITCQNGTCSPAHCHRKKHDHSWRITRKKRDSCFLSNLPIFLYCLSLTKVTLLRTFCILCSKTKTTAQNISDLNYHYCLKTHIKIVVESSYFQQRVIVHNILKVFCCLSWQDFY